MEQQRKNSNALVILLVAIIVIAVAIASVLISRTITANKTPQAAAPDAATSTVTTTTDPALAAPALQEPEQIEFLRTLPKRDPADPQATGAVDAPVVMIEFADFSCPMCAAFTASNLPALQEYVDAGVLRIEYRDFVIFDQQYGSGLAALGAWAAGQQEKFWEFYHAAMEKSLTEHAQWTQENVAELAQQVGVADLKKFEEDMASQGATQSVQTNNVLASQMGISGTPAFVINNRIIGGNDQIDAFKATIELAAADVAAGKF